MKLVRIRRRYKTLTIPKKLEIVEMFVEEKLTITKIALTMGLSNQQVSHALAQYGINRAIVSPGTQAITPEESLILSHARRIKKKFIDNVRKIKVRERIHLTADLPPMGDRWQLYNCSIQNAPIESGSVDCIVTDPPYIWGKIHVFKTLAQMGEKWLKPGGGMFVMVGHVWLPEVFDLMSSSGLEFHWMLCWRMEGGGGKNLAKGRNVVIGWKPILWYQKGRNQLRAFSDVVSTFGQDHIDGQAVHHWGQSVNGFEALVKRVSKVGDLVCDPFVGGGTTAIAALRSNRRFVGVDISKDAIETTKSRIFELNGSHGSYR